MSAAKGSIFITGANGGLGRGLISHIISTPDLASYHGLYTVRDVKTATSLKSLVDHASSTHSSEILSLDLCRLTQVRQVAVDINERVASGKIPKIRALILNAGLNDLGQQATTEDGFDMSFSSSYLGHWLLTLLLLQSLDPKHGRIVVLSASAYDVNHPIHELGGYFKDEKWRNFLDGDTIDGIAKGTWSSNETDVPEKAGIRRYGAAKMCAISMVVELQSRLDSDPTLRNISIVAIDPGSMNTGIVRRGNWFTRTILFPIIVPLLAPIMAWRSATPVFRTVRRSSADVMTAAFDPDPWSRGIYLDGSEQKDMAPEATDVRKREMVWRDSVRYTKLTQQDTVLARWA